VHPADGLIKRDCCHGSHAETTTNKAKQPRSRRPAITQPELRFVDSQQKAQPNGAGAQDSHHHTAEQLKSTTKMLNI